MRMTQEVKDKWVAALRSGEYVQGRDTLRTYDGKYCCLGVLQMCTKGKVDMVEEVYGEAQPAVFPDIKYWKELDPSFTPEMQGGIPLAPRLSLYLAEMNDGSDGVEAAPFAEIADYIEAHVEVI